MNFWEDSNDDPDIGLKIENVSFDFLVEDELIPAIAYAYAMGDEGMIEMTVTNNTDKAKVWLQVVKFLVGRIHLKAHLRLKKWI